MQKIKVTSLGYDLMEIAKEIGKSISESGLNLEIVKRPARNDAFSMSSEVASIIVSGMSVLSVLINALLIFLATRKSGSIIIVGSSGRKIEIPKDVPKEKILEYIELAKEIDSLDHVEINTR